MTALVSTERYSTDCDDTDRFERIRRTDRTVMPVHRSHLAIRASHRTAASRKASRRTSRRSSGMHHRRKHRAW